jgi:hypothetical protein
MDKAVILKNYMKRKGWDFKQFQIESDKLEIASIKNQNETIEIVIPKTENLRDFAFRKDQILGVLSDIEKRPIKLIALDIFSGKKSFADIMEEFLQFYSSFMNMSKKDTTRDFEEELNRIQKMMKSIYTRLDSLFFKVPKEWREAINDEY